MISKISKFEFWRKLDWSILSILLIIIVISLSAIYSVDISHGEKLTYFPTQAIALGIGLVAMFVAIFLQAGFYRSSAKIVYIFSLILLVAVLFFGNSIRGTTGWFRFGGFSFQPAEFAKLALVIGLAWWIEKYGRRFDKPQFVISSAILVGIPALFIMLQPDLGSALVLFGVWFLSLFVTGTKKRYIIILLSSFVLVACFAWLFFLQDYQKDRLLTFLDPARDPLDSGYNVTQSIIAIGAGQVVGRGLGFGSQSQLHFLPESQTDFIFSVIAEELGFIGIVVLLILYLLLFWRLLRLAYNCNEEFGAYLIIGIVLLFFTQMVVNIGGAVGLLPVTGVTLPLVSYGGSSLIINLLLIGIAQSVGKRAT